MKFNLLLILSGLLAACSPKQNDKASAPIEPTATAGQPALATDGAAPAPSQAATQAAPPATVIKSDYQLLQGRWQSNDDAQSVIELRGNLYYTYYAGAPIDTAEFILGPACSAAGGAEHPNDHATYLVEPKENMCWEITSLDDKNLTLQYTARGNLLTYRRIK